MKNCDILFTAPNVAQLVKNEIDTQLHGSEVLVETLMTAISAGTERDNLKGERNLVSFPNMEDPPYPRHFGYSGVAIVRKIGPDCKRLVPGQRVIVYFGKHSKYRVYPEEMLFPLAFDDISNEAAALLVIAGFPAEGVRKTRLEFGESAMVMGLGILGLMAVQLCHIAGASPVIAVDPNRQRREIALAHGADYAVDPTAADFQSQIQQITYGKGVDVAVDSAGNARATVQALECLARFGRISLLGCTRQHGEYDLYHLVHGKGVSIIGANNFARPVHESCPGNWTARDDIFALQKLVHTRRLDLDCLVNEIHTPLDTPQVYDRLVNGKDFPIGVLFDWQQLQP